MTGFSPPPTSQWYGNTVAISPWISSSTDRGGARILGNYGYIWMFNHGYDRDALHGGGAGGSEHARPGLYRGGNSGEHCDVEVTAEGSWSDAWGPIPVDTGVEQTAGKIAVIQGDSGGPVMTIAGSSLVNAAGMIQADLET